MSGHNFPNLMSPVTLGPVKIRNRFALTATAEVMSHANGSSNRRYGDYMLNFAKNDVGLLITGNRIVHPLGGTPARGYMWAYHEKNVEEDARFVRAIHEAGARVFMQLNHFGAHGNSMASDDYRVLKAPSRQASPVWNEMPDEFSSDDIKDLIKYYGRAARLAKSAGFDGIELHMTNAYLLHQFLSPLHNHRTDEFGGSLANRTRLPLLVLERVRQEGGAGMAVGVRLTTNENYPGGMGVPEWTEVAQRMTEQGVCDFVGFSAGTYHSFGAQIGIEDMPQYYLIDEIAEIKRHLHVPVIASGALQDPYRNEELVRAGHADMIGLSRPLLADPEYVRKVVHGKAEHIRRCIRCNQGCIARLFKAVAVACTINPEFGRERYFSVRKAATTPRRYLVVGGGVAGMKAATVLASRGHRVTLCEGSPELGGQVRLLARQPNRDSFGMLYEDLKRELLTLGVDIRTSMSVNIGMVRQLDPEKIILATGSTPVKNGRSGKFPFQNGVAGSDRAEIAYVPDIAAGREVRGPAVVILDDEGTRYTAGAAESLLDRGLTVHLVTPMPQLSPGLGLTLEQPSLYARLFRKGLQLHVNSWVKELVPGAAKVFNVYSGQEFELSGIGTTVLSTGREPELQLATELTKSGFKFRRIGDCLSPRLIDHALYDAALAGYEFEGEENYLEPGQLEGF